MSRVWTGIFGCAALAAIGAIPALAQYPGRVNPDQQSSGPHLRATAVLEYTGDLDKITASRLVPIAVWDGTQYQPGGLYLAQPAPLAVLSGTQYALESNGRSQGFFDVKDAEDLSGLWIGVGSFQKPAPPPPRRSRAESGHAYEVKDADPDKPHFAHRPSDENSGSGSSDSGNPDHPTLHNRTGSDSGPSGSPDSATSTQASVDPDRPTFHNRTVNNSAANQGAVDPDRPHLSYTTPESQAKLAKPDALTGFPADMKQITGISDSNPLDTQSFTYSWANPDDAAKVQADLETAAQQALAPPAPAAPAAPRRASAQTSRRRKPASPPPSLPTLADEDFHAYGLTFGGGATLVFSAHTTTEPEKYVTVIAQPDFYGHVAILLKQIASADSLDVTPRMILVDAVDTQGNNRGDLIFELRGQTYRQFAIYRIANGMATQAFITQPASMN